VNLGVLSYHNLQDERITRLLSEIEKNSLEKQNNDDQETSYDQENNDQETSSDQKNNDQEINCSQEDKDGVEANNEEYTYEFNFPNCTGTALCAIQGTINHSCSPNAQVYKRDLDWHGDTIVFALKPIATGEEICISYIDESLPLHHRRECLKLPYLFDCQCTKCKQEEAKNSKI